MLGITAHTPIHECIVDKAGKREDIVLQRSTSNVTARKKNEPQPHTTFSDRCMNGIDLDDTRVVRLEPLHTAVVIVQRRKRLGWAGQIEVSPVGQSHSLRFGQLQWTG